jgi:hypothetical protein
MIQKWIQIQMATHLRENGNEMTMKMKCVRILEDDGEFREGEKDKDGTNSHPNVESRQIAHRRHGFPASN